MVWTRQVPSWFSIRDVALLAMSNLTLSLLNSKHTSTRLSKQIMILHLHICMHRSMFSRSSIKHRPTSSVELNGLAGVKASPYFRSVHCRRCSCRLFAVIKVSCRLSQPRPYWANKGMCSVESLQLAVPLACLNIICFFICLARAWDLRAFDARSHQIGIRNKVTKKSKHSTPYHPPSQKSTACGRWKNTSLTAKLLCRATLILRYCVIRVLRNAVAASNHVVGIEFFCWNDVRKCLFPCLLSRSTDWPCQGAYGNGKVMNASTYLGVSFALNHAGFDLADSDVSASSAALWSSTSDEERHEKSLEEQDQHGEGVWRLL